MPAAQQVSGAAGAPTPDGWGILPDWIDDNRELHRVSDSSLQRLRELIGRPPADLADRTPIVVRPGVDLGLGPVQIDLEDSTTRQVEGSLPADFPLGYHVACTATGVQRPLIVSPGQCWLPAMERAWGWSVQLYAVRSRASWGIGDLADLRRLRQWAEELGAGFLLVNPLHAAAPTLPQQTSPYLPVSRRFRNPIYLRVEEVPGADQADWSDLAATGRRLNAASLIDRDSIWTLKLQALERIFTAIGCPPQFEEWRRLQGRDLDDFAVWCTLAERFGPDWRRWDPALHRPEHAAVQELATRSRRRVAFHAWLQWLLDGQLETARGDFAVIQDLPVGVDGGGADAWAWQEQLITGARVGAPPDRFNAAGQEWGSPPFNPWRLRADGYAAFIASVRATLAQAGGLRIDHVLGLFRLWCVPAGSAPAEGAYVRFPSADLLDVVALESVRAAALVVGEDLGTVEPGVRAALAAARVLSYRLLWFEDQPPHRWPAGAMAAVSTHDLPTVVGLWTGSDVAEQRRYLPGQEVELDSGRSALLSHLGWAGGPSAGATTEEAVLGAYRLLAEAPSVLLCATVDDAVLAESRPNLPGVVDRPNWCIPLPVQLEELVEHPTARALATVLRDAVRPTASANGSTRGRVRGSAAPRE